jgi:hypothetical protein
MPQQTPYRPYASWMRSERRKLRAYSDIAEELSGIMGRPVSATTVRRIALGLTHKGQPDALHDKEARTVMLQVISAANRASHPKRMMNRAVQQKVSS